MSKNDTFDWRWVKTGFFKPNVNKMEKNKDVDGLMKALKHKDMDVGRKAVESLGRIGAPALELLIQALKDEDVRSLATEALGRMGTPAVEPLIQALKDEYHVDSREMPAKALLGGFGIYKKVQHYIVRSGAAEALGKIGDARAVEPLIQALKDRDYDVRGKAAEALGKIGDARAVEPLIQALKDEYAQPAAIESLGKIGAPAVEPLIQYLVSVRPIMYTRGASVKSLIKIGAPAVEPLIQALKNEYNVVRSGAADSLGEIGSARAVEPLIKHLKINTMMSEVKLQKLLEE